ncbi:MAG TPA: Gfo/Idh/MocA family oxidoreductase [Candidatus Dormibacteraeota bacterium]|nr:Gfo/Idh/MocA family oxidoreductase [Candidatus Dormibacteraeota bacterium]
MDRFRLGIVDCDTSHTYQFSRRLNHVDIEPEQWVDGATVVAAHVGTSRVTEESRIAEYVAAIRSAGVKLVDSPRDLIGEVDGVLIESNEGGVHLDRARPFLAAGLPAFIDKPLATSTADARLLLDLAGRAGVPLLSASALRYAPELVALRNDAGLGRIEGADVYAPAKLHDRNPGLFHYGVHGVEMLYTLLGPGCAQVTCTFDESGEVVVGRWSDGRLGVVRGLRGRTSGYGLTVYGEEAIVSRQVDASWIYKGLVEAIVGTMLSGKAPVEPAELIEVVAFQEAALQSRNHAGAPVELATLLAGGAGD